MSYSKIVIVANNAAGLYLFRGMLIKRLISDGAKITALIPFGAYVDELRELGVKLIETPMDRRGINPLKDFKLLLSYFMIIRKEHPDLVITYTIKANIYAGIVSRALKKHYVVNITGLGTAFENKGLLFYVVRKLYKIALKKAHTVFFENSDDCAVFVKNQLVESKKTKVLNGAGVDISKFPYVKYPNNEVFSFLFIGRVMREKGVDELFQSMKRLINDGFKCELCILGSYEENYKQTIENYEAEGWLKYYGFQKAVKPYISACDCFVLPSYHEGMANTNLECASSGRPIITSNIPGCMEAVVDGSGLLCEPKDVDSLYLAMKAITEKSRDEREHMGLCGRKHMEEVFDKKKVVEETVKYLF